VGFIVREMDKDAMRAIGAVNREETIEANYIAQPADDGWGLVLRRTRCNPPVQASRWDEDDLDERIGWWLPELEKGGALIGAFDGERLVGFVVSGHKRGDESAELSAIFVDKDYRGKGAGSALMRAAEENAIRRGVRAMYIMSVPTAATVDFYVKQGYRIISVIDKSIVGSFPWDVVLAKHL